MLLTLNFCVQLMQEGNSQIYMEINKYRGGVKMIKIIELSENQDLLNEATHMFWSQWGSDENYSFYADCIKHSLNKNTDLPKFYVATEDKKIIGTYALLRNDLISRQEIYPWLACLYVKEEFRGNEIGRMMLEHAVTESRKRDFKSIYLSTNLDGYYERYGWTFFGIGYGITGASYKIYKKES